MNIVGIGSVKNYCFSLSRKEMQGDDKAPERKAETKMEKVSQTGTCTDY